MYAHFRVRACKVIIRVVNLNEEVLDCVMMPSTTTTNPDDTEQMSQQPYAVRWSVGAKNGGHNIKSRSCFVTSKNIVGEKLYSVNWRGGNGLSPANIIYQHLYIESQSGGDMQCAVQVKLKLYVHWSDKRIIDES
jgi:hypothetical protein